MGIQDRAAGLLWNQNYRCSQNSYIRDIFLNFCINKGVSSRQCKRNQNHPQIRMETFLVAHYDQTIDPLSPSHRQPHDV